MSNDKFSCDLNEIDLLYYIAHVAADILVDLVLRY